MNMKMMRDISINNIKKKLNLNNIDSYNKFFKPEIITKGDKLFKSNKIKNYKKCNNDYSCVISGTDNYDVFISYDKSDNIKSMSCTCPYFKKGNNCKHIYALIIESKLKESYKKLVKYEKQSFKIYKKEFNYFKYYFSKNISYYSEEDINKINNLIDLYKNDRIVRFKKLLGMDTTLIGYLSISSELDSELYEMKKKFMEIMKRENDTNIFDEYKQNLSNRKNSSKKGIFGGFITPLFYGITKGLSSPSPQKIKESKIKKWALEELEKGNTEPYITEYNDLEDDMFLDYDGIEDDYKQN